MTTFILPNPIKLNEEIAFVQNPEWPQTIQIVITEYRPDGTRPSRATIINTADLRKLLEMV